MLPKTKMGDAMCRKLKVYAGPDHPHTAQQPPEKDRGRLAWQASNTTARVAARHRPHAFSSGPANRKITVNHREFERYFTTDALRTQVRRPLLLTETGEKFDILATVDGGG